MKKPTTRFSRVFALKTFVLTAVCLTLSTSILATATIDTTFGTNGKASISLGDSQRIAAVAIQNNDKIVIVGDAWNGEATQRDGVVVRYNANGTLDQSFGNGGKVVLSVTPRDDSFYGVTIQADGKIVVVGSVSPTAGSSNTDFLIVRFNENGSLDGNFIGGGAITVNQGSQDSLRAVKIQPDGKIVAIGGTSDLGGRGAVIRLAANGFYDTSFGGGIVFVDRPSAANENFYSIDFYSNNRILLGGDLTFGNGPGSRVGFVTLLEPNGTIVQNFGSNGFLNTELSSSTSQNIVRILPNGNFISGSFPNIYTNEGVYAGSFVGRYITGLDFLSNGNLVVLSQQGSYPNINGIRIYNKALRFVGSDEKDSGLGISEFSGTNLEIQSNDKIIILREDVLLRLNGVTSNATRMAYFDEDKKTDIAVYRPSNRTAYLSLSINFIRAFQTDMIPARIIPEKFYANISIYSLVYWQSEPQTGSPGYFKRIDISGNTSAFQWGANGDIPVGGDYDGDGGTDYTVFRPSTGVWYVSQSSNNQFRAFPFGQAGDKLVPADYDYDGITDFAVFRPSNGTWYISRSSDGEFYGIAFGANGDIPAAGDYDGDGRADLTVFRPSNGTWYSLKSLEGFSAVAFGASGDQPVPGDYDGDGRHDAAVFRAGIWYLLQSRDGFRAVQWGLPTDVPVTVRY